jgi:hypothetical protein
VAIHVKRTSDTVPSGTRAEAAGVAMSGDDPASSVLTGYPGARVDHTETGAQGSSDAAAGMLTGYPGARTADHVHGGTHGLDDPAAGVLAGYPGARATHTETGGQGTHDPAAGVLTGYPGARTAGHVDMGVEGSEPTDSADGET